MLEFEEKEQRIKSLNEKINSLTQTYETKISELKESISELEESKREFLLICRDRSYRFKRSNRESRYATKNVIC